MPADLTLLKIRQAGAAAARAKLTAGYDACHCAWLSEAGIEVSQDGPHAGWLLRDALHSTDLETAR